MLYIVSTPIGNLKDITLRALETLKSVDYILCEDTRVTKKLLDHYQIKKPLISYHHHSNQRKTDKIIELIKDCKVALVTDAGTPGISDPGNKLITETLKYSSTSLRAGLKTETIIPIPGVSAVTAALSISGLPTDKFLFLGFVPHKKGRQKFLKQVLESKITVVFFESCYRIIKCIEELDTLIKHELNTDKQGYLDKHFVVCKELTKKFETIYRGNISEVLEKVKSDKVKGEYVVIAGTRYYHSPT